jgi:hypothetical protein
MAGAQVVIDVSNAPSFDPQGGVGILRDLRPQPCRGGGRGGRFAPYHAIHRWDRPGTRPGLLPRQSRAREADQGFWDPLHDHPLDPVPGIPQRDRRCEYGWKRRQACAGPASTYRG